MLLKEKETKTQMLSGCVKCKYTNTLNSYRHEYLKRIKCITLISSAWATFTYTWLCRAAITPKITTETLRPHVDKQCCWRTLSTFCICFCFLEVTSRTRHTKSRDAPISTSITPIAACGSLSSGGVRNLALYTTRDAHFLMPVPTYWASLATHSVSTCTAFYTGSAARIICVSSSNAALASSLPFCI
jgi:hypothetical protein